MTPMKITRTVVIALVIGGFSPVANFAYANGQGTPIEPNLAALTPSGPPQKACDVIVTVEQAAAIQTEIEAAVAAIEPSNPDAATLLANAATSIVAKHAAVTPNCPCSDSVVSYVTTALIQQARANGFADATLRRAATLLTAQIARDLSYSEVCVAAAVGSGEEEGTAAIDGEGDGPTVDRNLPPSVLDVAQSASGN